MKTSFINENNVNVRFAKEMLENLSCSSMLPAFQNANRMFLEVTVLLYTIIEYIADYFNEYRGLCVRFRAERTRCSPCLIRVRVFAMFNPLNISRISFRVLPRLCS